ncbi:MAG: hypothetical protein KDE62_00715, partial [Calditrichaeota bacterium]|nr:hypothetical protein [Calditrichota bacterium]
GELPDFGVNRHITNHYPNLATETQSTLRNDKGVVIASRVLGRRGNLPRIAFNLTADGCTMQEIASAKYASQ